MSRATTMFSPPAMQGLADRLPDPESVDVTIEVLDESFGDQLEADRLPWHALVYDTRSDVIELSVGGRDRIRSYCGTRSPGRQGSGWNRRMGWRWR